MCTKLYHESNNLSIPCLQYVTIRYGKDVSFKEHKNNKGYAKYIKMSMQNKINCATINFNGLLMDKINEEALIDSANNDAVENLEIKQTEEGSYQLIIKLIWKDHPSILMTSRDDIKLLRLQ